MKNTAFWSVILAVALVALVGASVLAGPGGNTVLRNTVRLNASAISVTGGDPVDLTVTLAYPTVVDTPVAITPSPVEAFSAIPSFVVIPAGMSGVTFTATTAPTTTTVKAVVTATMPDSSTGTTKLTITP